MNETKLGKEYFEILAAVKDQLASNLVDSCSKMELDYEKVKKIIFVAQGTVDAVGGNALPALIKSCK